MIARTFTLFVFSVYFTTSLFAQVDIVGGGIVTLSTQLSPGLGIDVVYFL